VARPQAPTRQPLTPPLPGLLTACRSGTAVWILHALVTPVLPELAVMEPAQQMCVVIQPIGGAQHLVKVMAVILRRSFLLRPLADNAQLFPDLVR
jgi:hypothetical protein